MHDEYLNMNDNHRVIICMKSVADPSEFVFDHPILKTLRECKQDKTPVIDIDNFSDQTMVRHVKTLIDQSHALFILCEVHPEHALGSMQPVLNYCLRRNVEALWVVGHHPALLPFAKKMDGRFLESREEALSAIRSYPGL